MFFDKLFKSDDKEETNIIPIDGDAGLEIVYNQLPAEAVPDDSALVEITDKNILARIDQLIPGMVQAGASLGTTATLASQEVYKVIIPPGKELMKSHDMEGAVRAMFRGEKGMGGHANLVKADQTGMAVANTAAAAMGVASMVVGQYYMAQITSELGEISDSIDSIRDFQNDEYKSRVLALMVQVKRAATFKSEIIENGELRVEEINHLRSLEDECIRLLGQANIAIEKLTTGKKKDTKDYGKTTAKIKMWYGYLQILTDILYKISDLDYVLHVGRMSREQSQSTLKEYENIVQNTQMKLRDWHEKVSKHFGIDFVRETQKRSGVVGVLARIPGKVNKDLKSLQYKSFSSEMSDMIFEQAYGDIVQHKGYDDALYEEDVELIAKDGKIYYLHSVG